MNVQKWLERGQKLSEEISELLEAKNNAVDLATSVTSSRGGERVVMSKANYNEQRFLKVAELSEMIDKKVNLLMDLKRDIITAIYKVEDIRLRTLLIARYINFKTWDEIAKNMHYSDKWVRTRLHRGALEAVEESVGF